MSDIRVAHVSDLHINSARASMFMVQQWALDEIVRAIASCKPDVILLTGDLAGHDAPHEMTHQERSVVVSFMVKLMAIAPLLVVRGNHDALGEISTYSALTKVQPNGMAMIAAERPERYEVSIRGVPLLFRLLPWETRYAAARRLALSRNDSRSVGDAIIADVAPTAQERDYYQYCLLVTHHEIEGALVGGYELKSQRDISLSPHVLDSSGFVYSALGHIHQNQSVGQRSVYAGSPFPLTFGERAPKGFQLITLENGKASSVLIPVRTWDMVDVQIDVTEETVTLGEYHHKPEYLFVRPVVHCAQKEQALGVDWDAVEAYVKGEVGRSGDRVFLCTDNALIKAEKSQSYREFNVEDQAGRAQDIESRIADRIRRTTTTDPEWGNRLYERFVRLCAAWRN